MKRLTSKEMLAASFRELAESRPIDKITTKDIAENCGYSQATFYRQFKDKYDLIAWAYTRDLEAILDELTGEEVSLKQMLPADSAIFTEHADMLTMRPEQLTIEQFVELTNYVEHDYSINKN